MSIKLTKSQILLYFCFLYIISVFIYSLVENSQPFLFDQIDQEISLNGTIIGEPEYRINQQKFEFKSEEVSGKVLITTELYPKYYYGDQLEIFGKLQEPIVFEDFNYKEYLRKDEIYSVSYYPSINLMQKNQGNWFFQRIFNFKDKLRNVIEQTLLPPQSSVLKAVFLGDKYGLSNQLKEKLNITGTRHIVAISGMHMIIMTQILLFLGLALGLWRHQVFYFVLIILIFYIIMIGAPPSAIRAGIMASLLLLAQRFGRLRTAGRSIVFAATIMLIFNPLLLKLDVGFQLSFLATLGIVYLKPIIDKRIENWPNSFKLKDILTMTLAAQCSTLPVLIFHFGRLSLISPLANILIVPLLPVIMIGGIVLSLSGCIWIGFAQIIAWLIYLVLNYLILVVEYLSKIPLAVIEFKSISLIILIGYYLFLIFFIYRQREMVK